MVRRLGDAVDGGTAMQDGRDVWWHDIVDRQSEDCPARRRSISEHMLYLLYTSGTTAKPKGILHTTAGYLLGTRFTHEMVFDIKPDDVYWCAADIGWVTGHSYIVYGPLANATTGVLYEGAPDTPGLGPLVADHRGLQGHDPVLRPDRDPGLHEAGRGSTPRRTTCRRCACSGRSASRSTPRPGSGTGSTSARDRTPIVDTWWQTETGHDHDHAAARGHHHEAGQRHLPVPRHRGRRRRRRRATPCRSAAAGYLVLKRPWPAMLRGIYGDPERYKETYWSRFPGMYFAGDGAKRDVEGYLWLLGRVDDVMNVAGHRISTTEVESALVSTTRPSPRPRSSARRTRSPARRSSRSSSSSRAWSTSRRRSSGTSCASTWRPRSARSPSPKGLMFVPDLPKTRSGKIMRRLLRDIAEGRALGDTTTLADAGVVETIRENTGKAGGLTCRSTS